IKLFLEVSIVYFLLLLSLRLVGMYAGLKELTPTLLASNARQSLLGERAPDEPFCSAAAAFAVFSWVWNCLMIMISLDVNRPEVLNILSGHLDERVVSLFPVIRGWRRELTATRTNLNRKCDTDVATYKENSTEEKLEALKTSMAKSWIASHLILLKFLLLRAHHVILPYLFVYHIVALNLVLGGFIFLSLHARDGASVLGVFPAITWPWILAVCILLLLFALIAIGLHLDAKKEKSNWEWIGCLSMVVAVVLAYASLPTTSLVLLMVVQQILANMFMGHYFTLPGETPPEPVTQPTPEAPSEPSPTDILVDAGERAV
ncbi:MAG: hypothetical protein ACYC44_03285, partial [Patescibacteria group bacterium]